MGINTLPSWHVTVLIKFALSVPVLHAAIAQSSAMLTSPRRPTEPWITCQAQARSPVPSAFLTRELHAD